MDAQAKKALFRAKLKEQAQKTRIDSPLVSLRCCSKIRVPVARAPSFKETSRGSGTPKSMSFGSSVKAGPSAIQVNQGAETSISGSETTQTKEALPEGFFDNKEADLRARGIQIVKPDVKDEYKEFEKLIQEDLQEVDNRFEEEEIDAAEMIEEEETVEHMTYKERIDMLKRKKRELVDSRPSKPGKDSNPASKKSKFNKDESSSDDDESFAVDWRAQHL